MQKEKELSLEVTEKKISPIVEKVHSLEIVDQKSLSEGVEYLSQINKYLDSVIAYKEKKTKPLNALLKIVRDETRPIETALEVLVREVKGKLSVYQTEAERVRLEAEQAIADRIGQGKGKLKVETAVKQIENLETVEKSVEAESGKVMFKTVKKFEITDIRLLPLDCIMPNESIIREKMKAGIEVAGVRYYSEQVPTNFR